MPCPALLHGPRPGGVWGLGLLCLLRASGSSTGHAARSSPICFQETTTVGRHFHRGRCARKQSATVCTWLALGLQESGFCRWLCPALIDPSLPAWGSAELCCTHQLCCLQQHTALPAAWRMALASWRPAAQACLHGLRAASCWASARQHSRRRARGTRARVQMLPAPCTPAADPCRAGCQAALAVLQRLVRLRPGCASAEAPGGDGLYQARCPSARCSVQGSWKMCAQVGSGCERNCMAGAQEALLRT